MKFTMQDYVEQTLSACQALLSSSAQMEPLIALYKKKKPETLWLVASGSSFNACACAQPLMTRWMETRVELMTPFTFLYYTPDIKPNDLIVVITQSGLSTNAIAVLDRWKDNGNIVCLTGNREADVKDHTGLVLEYGVGEELVGYVTKGVSVLCVYWLRFAQLVSGCPKHEIESALQAWEDAKANTPRFVQDHWKALSAMQTVYCLGTPQSAGAGMEAALKIGETIHVPSVYYEVEEFIHGPNLQLTPNYTLFFFDSNDDASDRLHRVYEAARAVTNQAYLITMDPAYQSDPNALVIEPKVDAGFSSLAALPVPQLVSALVSEQLHSTMQHPLLKQFKRIVSAKTENFVNYDEDEA